MYNFQNFIVRSNEDEGNDDFRNQARNYPLKPYY